MPKTSVDPEQKLLDDIAEKTKQLRAVQKQKRAAAAEAHTTHLMTLARVLDDLGYGSMTPEELRRYLQQERRPGMLGNPEDAEAPLLDEEAQVLEEATVGVPQSSSVSNGWFRTRDGR